MKKLTILPKQNKISYGADKDIPRLLWKDGITNMTDITISQKVGIMFTIVVMSLQSDGIEFFNHVLKKPKIVHDMRQCFQIMLCYWMWLKKKKYRKEIMRSLFQKPLMPSEKY